MKNNERMVVSAYQDGEVESPWKERVAQRIADDPQWAAEAERHRRVKDALAKVPEDDAAEILARVKANILERPPKRAQVLSVGWLSVAAAALLVITAGGGYWLGRQGATTSTPSEVAELQVQVPKAMGLQLSGEGQLLMASTLQRTSH